MARTHYVKSFRGQRKCQWSDPADGPWGIVCGYPRNDPIHDENTPLVEAHPFTQKPLVCSACGKDINIDDPYKWVAPRAYPGAPSSKKTRHADCPGWKPSELTSSPHLSTLYGAQEEADEALAGLATPTTEDEIEGFKSELEAIAASCAEGAREAEESYTESADNIEEGFGHETYQSEELREKADQIASYCDDLDGYVADEYDGVFVGDMDPDDYEDEDEMMGDFIDQLDAWAETAKDELMDMTGEVPL